SNPEAEKFMRSDAGSTALAKAIFNGVRHYRSNASLIDDDKPRPSKGEKGTAEPLADEKKVEKVAPDSDISPVVYKIQFLSSPSKLSSSDSRLKGIDKIDFYRDGKIYKYTSGAFSSQGDALKSLNKIRKKYPDAFIIRTRDGKRIK
ncbi:MAG: SPOR domain-containing protein, partial [Duncaniella sp.]|nr:SPOR domain-containing protein [Duncaniella sp.]